MERPDVVVQGLLEPERLRAEATFEAPSLLMDTLDVVEQNSVGAEPLATERTLIGFLAVVNPQDMAPEAWLVGEIGGAEKALELLLLGMSHHHVIIRTCGPCSHLPTALAGASVQCSLVGHFLVILELQLILETLLTNLTFKFGAIFKMAPQKKFRCENFRADITFEAGVFVLSLGVIRQKLFATENFATNGTVRALHSYS